MTTYVRPRMGKIPAAVDYSSISRSKLYALAAANPGLFKKFGRSVIVGFDILDRILDVFPDARIKPSLRKPVDVTATRIA